MINIPFFTNIGVDNGFQSNTFAFSTFYLIQPQPYQNLQQNWGEQPHQHSEILMKPPKRRNLPRETSPRLHSDPQGEEDQYVQERRKYRPRRKGLNKCFSCKINDCGNQYSSKMALRNHERLKHGIRIRKNSKQV